MTISGTAGMGCIGSFWCTGQPVPDTSDASPSEIFLTSVNTLILAGVTYDASSLFFTTTNGFFDQNGGLNASIGGLVGGPTGAFQFNLTLPTNGSWGFDFVPTTDEFGNPAFSFTEGSFSASAPLPTPEPGTIGLMLTGLAGIGGIVKRKKTFRR